MGILLSRGAKHKLLVIGEPDSGKATFLQQLKQQLNQDKQEIRTVIPFIGFQLRILELPNFTIHAFNTTGYYQVWCNKFHEDAEALIFIIDANDRDNHEAFKNIKKKMKGESLQELPILIYANKQDLPGALSASEITLKLGLFKMKTRKWFVQACCTASGAGVKEGFAWLVENIVM